MSLKEVVVNKLCVLLVYKVKMVSPGVIDC